MTRNQKTKIVVGAGEYHNNPGWLHLQKDELNLIKRDDWLTHFEPSSLSIILAEHVWEHLTIEEGIQAAALCYEFLKPGGYVRCAVPDRYFPNEAYQTAVQIGGPGPLDHPASSHKVVHTYHTLSSLFETAGFRISLLEYHDEKGQFHQNDWHKEDGMIYRSKQFDHRNESGTLQFVSLLLDARKP
ncbi:MULTISPECIES: class I SAM-dependent methyltransferase [Bacillaceae]|uniref:SAM-dependent methyltransferase n=1 Tax=Alkalicoccobacillus plakortidis TaxID=444060 RepID=A0A9D5I0B4_9BACI|nr:MULTISPECIES: hypothetical protein [Bacillaceae]KQL56284.1 putative SAM-dependent methyltransferase [Alkalicoccobacillus plakortidis]